MDSLSRMVEYNTTNSLFNTHSPNTYPDTSFKHGNIVYSKYVDNLHKNFSSFSVVHINAGAWGLRKSGQLEQLSALLGSEEFGFDAAVVSEAWLKDEDSRCFEIPGFSFLVACRQGSRPGGGAGMYVRSSCRVLSSETLSSDDGNIQGVKALVSKYGFKGHLIGIYNNHQSNEENLLDFLDVFLPMRDKLPCIMVGDCNVNLLDWASAGKYVPFFRSRGFEHLVRSVTRPSSGTCLDHIAIRNCEQFLDVRSYEYRTAAYSDHYPVLLTITGNNNLGGTPSEVRFERTFGSKAIPRMGEGLLAVDWSPVLQASDVDDALRRFNDLTFDVYDKLFPLRETREDRVRPDGFRFSEGLKRLRRDVDSAHYRYIKYRTDEAKSTYYRKRNRYRHAFR